MPDGTPSSPNPFDVQTIRQLVALMSRNDLSEIDLRVADQRIRLRRGKLPSVLTLAPGSAALSSVPMSSAPGTPAESDGASKPPAKNLKEIKSPLVGTFYSSAKPGAEPFVKAGSKVTPTTVVGLIEAMKLFNDIAAECNGTIAEVLVQNQQAVEYGQVLFLVDPS